MKFKDYQKYAHSTAEYPTIMVHGTDSDGEEGFTNTTGWVYPALGLVGEAGEVAEKIKKVLRNNNGVMTKEAREQIGKEIGDVLWYCAELASSLKLDLGVIAEQNLEKLSDRTKRNVICSEGDNR